MSVRRPSHQVSIAVPCLVLGCRGPEILGGDQPALAPVCCAGACVYVCVCARERQGNLCRLLQIRGREFRLWF